MSEYVFSPGMPPPKSLVKSDTTVIVSTKRPVVVYFDRAKEVLYARLLDSRVEGPVEVFISGAGGAIPRCEQVARYLMQELQSKCKSIVRSAEKSVTKGTVTAKEFRTSEIVDDSSDDEELLALNMTSNERKISTVSIRISVVRN